MSRQWVRWLAASVAVVGLALLGTALWYLRPTQIRRMAEQGLTRHLKLEAHFEDITVRLFPRPQVAGTGFTLRLPGRPDLPPFISIDRFVMNVGLLSMMRKHVETVHADGLRITVPPSGSRDALPDASSETSRGLMRDIIIDRFLTHDAELTFVRRRSDRTPLTFAIQDLSVSDIGFAREIPFTATLTNPIPRGLVRATGSVGPWTPGNIDGIPVSGKYTFEHADLSTINGIGGTLESTGEFGGTLSAIAANGEARIPDFSLDLGGKPVTLTATFQTIVDGTDGTTTLRQVDATLGQTRMRLSGAISNLSGPGRHDVDLSVEIANGRVEDLLMLVLDTPKPVMIGEVDVTAHFALPPGPTRTRDRVTLEGRFGLDATHFTDAQVQGKLQDLSRRSQGKDDDDPLGRVLTNLRGEVRLVRGTAHLQKLTFQVPGATVALDGRYELESGALDFRGTLRMQATVSKAIGGFKSIFIKPFDGLFRKDGAGAVLPIKITGTRMAPKFGLEVGRVFKRR